MQLTQAALLSTLAAIVSANAPYSAGTVTMAAGFEGCTVSVVGYLGCTGQKIYDGGCVGELEPDMTVSSRTTLEDVTARSIN